MSMGDLTLAVNGKSRTADVASGTPLLWVLRDSLGLTGTKYGCGRGLCGSCTVHLDGEAVRSCVTPVSMAEGKEITTIEGLGRTKLTAVQEAWVAEDVPQCGYCQAGQIMTAAALLARLPNPSDDDIDQSMAMNLCRCGTYLRIRRAIHRAAKELATGDPAK